MTARAAASMQAIDGRRLDKGLVVLRASRLEALLPPLVELLAATRPANVLAAQTIVAAHPGMRQWLQGELARAPGMGGIAANLDVVLPSAWIDELARQRLGQGAVALPRYRQRHLRWTIHALLSADVAALGIVDARVTAYLGEAAHAAEQARRRFQLADRLARIYSQYLVYRPDWLRAWEAGRRDAVTRGGADATMATTERDLLAPLWRHLRAKLGVHRGDVVAELIPDLEAAPLSGGDALHVFGLSHMAPSELALLRAFARHQLVALYVPDPCREFWAGIGRDLHGLHRYRSEEQARIEQAAGQDYWVDHGHPLLARWGRMGQHFLLALSDGEGDVLEDVRHWQDEQVATPRNRLERVQQSIRALDPSLLVPYPARSDEVERRDASLRVHACHTRLRELEVLRDQLLDALDGEDAEGRRLKPSDIVVMAPDIQAYAPLIPTVFGLPGDARAPLPYHLADIALARSHPLFDAFRRVLDLPGTRVSAPEVVDLLSVAELSRRLGLDPQGVELLSQWLRQSRVAWALDASFRARFGVPKIAEHTFAWALDRMLAGYLMADAANAECQPAVRLADGTELAPLTGIDGPGAAQLGALDQLLQEIQRLCDLADQTLPASVWADELDARFEALFRIDPLQRDSREAGACVRQLIRAIALEPDANGEDPLLHFSVVRDLLVEQLASVPERQRFLMGGITFCGMVPQRAIPFQVVAVLGLNDGEFPRGGSDAGLDLMSRHRRLGDRDVRGDDRYLFLETVMSARTRLHLSYIGEGVRDGKPRNSAAPLAELMAALDAATPADQGGHESAWHVRHPLQPFDPRYFDARDPRLFSYDARYAAMDGEGTQAAVAPFFDARHARALSIDAPVTLRELNDYYRDPARQVLARRMQLRLDALVDDRLPQDEPIEPRFEAIEGVTRRLFFEHVAAMPTAAAWPPAQAPAWLRLSGRMPVGRAGQQAWQRECAAVGALIEKLDESGMRAHGALVATIREIDLPLQSWRLTGSIERVFASTDDGQPMLRLLRAFPDSGGLKKESALTFKERVPMFLDWALLRIASAREAAPLPAVRLVALVEGDSTWLDGIVAWDRRFVAADASNRRDMLADIEARVAGLVGFWRTAQGRPPWYFPKTAWAVLKAATAPARAGGGADDTAEERAERIASAAIQAWCPDSGIRECIGERDYAPGYARILAGDVDFAAGSTELAELISSARQLNAWISFDQVPA